MVHTILKIISTIAAVGILCSSLYYVLCIWSAAIFFWERKRHEAKLVIDASSSASSTFLPAISILKPLKGIDPEMYESFRSHCLQDYPKYEIVFGVSDPHDPAVDKVKELQRDFPARKIQLVYCPNALGTNIKVSNLSQMTAAAEHEYLIVNDSDIRVERDYLRRVIAPLSDPGIGMVTCLYRGVAAPTLGSCLEALGISTDFSPSVLAARQLEHGIRFGLGSTLCFRRRDLEELGGFSAFLDYLADDYELGKRIAELGLRVDISDVVVETFLPPYSFWEFLSHQLRWARGIKDARHGGYFGLMFTFGTFWAVLALAASRTASWAWIALAAVLVLRSATALIVGGTILRDRQVRKYFLLIPLRDLIAVAIWIASFAGNTVTWRGSRFNLKNGKLSEIPR